MSFIKKIEILSKVDRTCLNCDKPRPTLDDAFCKKCDKDHAICSDCGSVVDLKKPHGGNAKTGYVCKDCK